MTDPRHALLGHSATDDAFATTTADVERGLLPRPVRRGEPHWYLTLRKSGCLLCGYAPEWEQRIRMPGKPPDDPNERIVVDEYDWACGSHFC